MGLGVDLISKAATAVGTKIVKKAATGVAVTAAGTAVTGIEKAQGLAALTGMRINSRKGMQTKEEFFYNNPNAYLLTIPDMEIDTRTIYNKSESFGQAKKQFSVYCGNGLWLCENHHKLFDERMITFGESGELLFHRSLEKRHIRFIDEITLYRQLPDSILTERFIEYLWRRMKSA